MTLILTTNDPVKSRMPTMSATGAVLRYRDDTFMRSSASSFPQVHVQGDRSFSDEKATFEDMLPMLLARFPGEYVAVFRGDVVDHGPSRRDIVQRFFARFTKGPVYIGFVGPKRVIRQVSPFRSRRDARLP